MATPKSSLNLFSVVAEIFQCLEPRLRLDDVLGQGLDAVGHAAAGGVALLLDLRQCAIELDLALAQFIEHRRDGSPRFGDFAELFAQGLLSPTDVGKPGIEIGSAAAAAMGRGQKLGLGHPLVQRQQRVVGVGRDHVLDCGIEVALRFIDAHRCIDQALAPIRDEREFFASAFGARRLPDHGDHQVEGHQHDACDHRLLRMGQGHECRRRLVPIGLQGLVDQDHCDAEQCDQDNQRQPHGRSSTKDFRHLQSVVVNSRPARSGPACFTAWELGASARNSAVRAPP